MTSYKLRELTPESERCGVGPCPSIYEVKNDSQGCFGGVGCPEVIPQTDRYLIIGKKLEPKEYGLEQKVAEHEVLIEVPRNIIDKLDIKLRV